MTAMTPVSAPSLAGTGIDAAATVTSSAVAACTDAGRSAARCGSGAVPATPDRDGGVGAELASAVPVLHLRSCMTPHTHVTRDERAACDAEHDTVRRRWDDPDLTHP